MSENVLKSEDLNCNDCLDRPLYTCSFCGSTLERGNERMVGGLIYCLDGCPYGGLKTSESF